MPVSKSSKARIAIALGAVALTGFLLYREFRPEPADAEAVAALAKLTYRVRCNACMAEDEMAGQAYVASLTPSGARCPKCGKDMAWKTEIVRDSDVAAIEIGENLTTATEIQEAMADVGREMTRLEKRIREEGLQPDTDAYRAARKEYAMLQSKLQRLGELLERVTGP